MSKPNILTDITAQRLVTVGNLTVSNALTTSNMFASNVVAAGIIRVTGVRAIGRLTLSVNGNVSASNALVTTNVLMSGDLINAGRFSTTGNIFASNAVTTTNVIAYGNVISLGVLTPGMTTLYVTGNVFSSNAITTGSLITTNVYASDNIYSNNNVTLTGNIYVSNAVTTGNIFGAGELTIGQNITVTGLNTIGRTTLNMPRGNVYVANTVVTTNVYASGTFKVTGAITVSNVYSGNAIQTTNVWVTNVFSDAMTVVGFPGKTSLSLTGNVFVSNTITASNVYAAGNVYATGNVYASGMVKATTGNVFVSNSVMTTNVFAAGNVSAFNAFITGASTLGFTTLSVPGNAFASNSLTTGAMYVSGNVYATGNILVGNLFVTGNATISNTCVASNVYSNLFTTDGLYITGNATFSNAVTATNVFAINVWATSSVTLATTTLTVEALTEGLQATTIARYNRVPSYSETFIVPVTSGLVGRYDITSWNNSTKVWSDLSGAGNNTTAFTGTPLAGTNYVYGGTGDSLTWPTAILPTTYTFFHVARHSGATRQRIFQGVTTNFISGFHIGTAGVAYHEGWMTPDTDLHGRNWVMSTDQNSLYRSNGVTRGTTGGNGLTTRLGLNTGAAVQPSDWQCAEVLVYNRTLTGGEISQVESYLQYKYPSFTMFPAGPTFGTPVQVYGANADEFCDNIGLSRYINGVLYPQVVVNPPAPSLQAVSGQSISSSVTSAIPILQYQQPIGPLLWTMSGHPSGVYLSNTSSYGCNVIVPYLQASSTGTVTVTATNRNGLTGTTSFSLTVSQGTSPFVLYAFSEVRFSPGGATLSTGPSIGQARSGLAGAPAPSDWYSSYLSMNTNGKMIWTVPETTTYRIVAIGARGGRASCYNVAGGHGAYMQGEFALTRGTQLTIVVGQMGQEYCHDTGGGGGSFVVNTSSESSPLIIAGGGGGAAPSGFNGSGSIHANTGTSGYSTAWTSGGSSGAGGGSLNSGGGGGLTGDGGGGGNGWYGRSLTNGATGGGNQSYGGFGGGGGGGGTNGAGGGGGYSGGAASYWSYEGAGGGSYNGGSNQTNTQYVGGGMGSVVISKLSYTPVLYTESTILTTSTLQTNALSLFRPTVRLFRASVNGYASTTFHSLCNGYAPLFFVFRTTSGYIATAYTVASFNSVGNYTRAQSGTNYLNNLWNGSSISLTKYYNTSIPNTSLYDADNYGPTFGQGHDIHVPNNSASIQSNPSSYTIPNNSILFGGSGVALSDYEVYV
jgi:hypothetical protein